MESLQEYIKRKAFERLSQIDGIPIEEKPTFLAKGMWKFCFAIDETKVLLISRVFDQYEHGEEVDFDAAIQNEIEILKKIGYTIFESGKNWFIMERFKNLNLPYSEAIVDEFIARTTQMLLKNDLIQKDILVKNVGEGADGKLYLYDFSISTFSDEPLKKLAAVDKLCLSTVKKHLM